MSKFNKPTRRFSDEKQNDRPNREGRLKGNRNSDRPRFKDHSGKADEQGEKKSYKQKRSFTKNKELREKGGFKRDGFDRKDSFKRNDTYRSSGHSHKPKPFKDKEKTFDEGSEKRSFGKRNKSDDNKSYKKEGRNFGDRDRKFSREDKEERSSRSDSFERKKGSFKPKSDSKNERPYREKSDRTRRSFNDKKEGFGQRNESGNKRSYSEKSEGYSKESGKRTSKPYKGRNKGEEDREHRRVDYREMEEGRSFSNEYKNDRSKSKGTASKKKSENANGLTRLNKYLSNAGIASRREADTLIKSGVVKVNGVPVTEMGFKVKPGDVVTYADSAVKSERKVYLLLNKPKDYITTVDDPQERKTVMHLIEDACRERVYPVGRLDRNTTGLLLFTNDGELTKKLTHPKHEIKKVYHVSLNKGLKAEDFKAITEGIELEDGLIAADDLAFVGEGKKEVGIEIHSGRNRIVRRIFEHLGYDVLKLDRVMFAGLTKKDLPRGKYRFLTQKEVAFLQMIG